MCGDSPALKCQDRFEVLMMCKPISAHMISRLLELWKWVFNGDAAEAVNMLVRECVRVIDLKIINAFQLREINSKCGTVYGFHFLLLCRILPPIKPSEMAHFSQISLVFQFFLSHGFSWGIKHSGKLSLTVCLHNVPCLPGVPTTKTRWILEASGHY